MIEGFVRMGLYWKSIYDWIVMFNINLLFMYDVRACTQRCDDCTHVWCPLYLTGNVSYRSNNWTIPNFIHKIFSLNANSEITLMLSVEHVAFNVYFETLKQYFFDF